MGKPADSAAERLAWELRSWKSIEIRVHANLVNAKASADPMLWSGSDTFSHYVETADGLRMFEERIVPSSGDEILNMYFSNGKLAADVNRGTLQGKAQESVIIKRDFGMESKTGWYGVPEPLLYFYVGMRPLHEVLPSAEYLGQGSHLNRDCDLFLFTRAKHGVQGDFVYALDRETSIPLKVSVFTDANKRAEGTPASTWSAESLDEVNGRHIPLRSSQAHYSRVDPSEAVLKRSILVESVEFDKDYPRATFWPKISPEATVFNSVPSEFKAPVAKDTGARKLDVQASSVAGQTGLRVVDRGHWSDMVAPASLALGVAVLVASVVLWRRRQRNS